MLCTLRRSAGEREGRGEEGGGAGSRAAGSLRVGAGVEVMPTNPGRPVDSWCRSAMGGH